MLLLLPNLAKAEAEFGFDMNIPFALTGIDSGRYWVAGTVSAANSNSRFEVAMPFFLHQHTYDPDYCCIVNIKRFDVQLRAFENTKRQGLYFGLIARHSSVMGRDFVNHNKAISYSRVGAGAVLGFRTMFKKRFYWGANLNIGRFFSDGTLLAHGDEGPVFFSPSDNGSDAFFNIELLKAGIRF